MSKILTVMKKSLLCESNPPEVSEPNSRKTIKCSCCCKPKSKALAPPSSSLLSCTSTLKVVFHSNKRSKQQTLANQSPLSIRSSDLINPVTHHVRFKNSELNFRGDFHHACGSPSNKYNHTVPTSRPRQKVLATITDDELESNQAIQSDTSGPSRQGCHECGELLAGRDAEDHLLSKHAVTEVLEDDSSREVIEMIFKAGWIEPDNGVPLERILKVNNSQAKLAQFEEYREMIKTRANKLQHSNKHPRLLADGNELLRFYGTTIACSLGKKGSSDLCKVCCILRDGFGTQDEKTVSVPGIYTTTTGERAYRSIDNGVEDEAVKSCEALRKALIVCRAIAGRVHRPEVKNVQEFESGKRSLFDSLAGELGSDTSHVQELFVLNSTALLPCFVIICKHRNDIWDKSEDILDFGCLTSRIVYWTCFVDRGFALEAPAKTSEIEDIVTSRTFFVVGLMNVIFVLIQRHLSK